MKKQNILKEALTLADAATFAAILPDEDWTPSPEYRERINRLTRKERNFAWRTVNTTGKRAAAVILALLIIFGSMMSVKAIRESVVEFILSIFSEYTAVEVNLDSAEDAPKEIEIYYSLTYLPEGYHIESIDDDEWRRVIQCFNEKGELIHFVQETVDTIHTMNTEGTDLVEIKVSGNRGYYYVNKGYLTVFWSNGEYLFNLFAKEELGYDEMIRMAEGISTE